MLMSRPNGVLTVLSRNRFRRSCRTGKIAPMRSYSVRKPKLPYRKLSRGICRNGWRNGIRLRN